jgi:DNA-binding transcriptional MerR regulator
MAPARSKTRSPRRKLPSSTSVIAARIEPPLKIGQAARTLGVEAYVLRFWETQFPFLRPRHAASSHRIYQAKDLELLLLVKRLLHVEGYTIAGAKKHIREIGLERLCGKSMPDQIAPDSREGSSPDKQHASLQSTLKSIRDDLKSLQKLIG